MIVIICMAGVLCAGPDALPENGLPEWFANSMPEVAAFEEWLRTSGESMPDMGAMPSHAPLPNPLAPRLDGKVHPIRSAEAWEQERGRLMSLLHHWVLGSVPPPPDNLRAEALSETVCESGARVREVELRFGPGHKAKLWMQVSMPPGAGPFPVFMTQENHRGWAQIALARGYITCIYAGADSRDDTDTFLEAWPKHDWSRLMRRGWAAGRCLDYLAAVPEADLTRAILTGHSRNGKASLMGAAVDPRFAAVISSSSGVGGCMPSRYCGEHQFAEGIEQITRSFPEWFHPRWRFFSGNEHKVPVDLHHLVALSAPRACLLSIAFNDDVENTWAMQHVYRACKPVWELYGEAERFRILWRAGGHETRAETIERYLDWCDAQFGRGQANVPEEYIYPWDWDAWCANATLPFTPETLNDPLDTDPDTLRAAARHMLGEGPAWVPVDNMTYGRTPEYIMRLLDRADAGLGLEMEPLVFGEYLNGDVYAPLGTAKGDARLPAVLYLAPRNTAGGYTAGYRRGEQAYRTLARAGCAVCCFDPIGTGRRVEEAKGFYDRYPGWSLLGKMVHDARAALHALMQLPYVDPERVWVVGYETGALTALHLAAWEDRPCGYALVCPPLPYRMDTDELETGGMRRWSHETMLLPQLGVFIGHESRIPYDLDQLMAAMAPRPLVLVTPAHDRFAPADKMETAVAAVRRAYAAQGLEGAVVRSTPETYNHFDISMQQELMQIMVPHLSKK